MNKAQLAYEAFYAKTGAIHLPYDDLPQSIREGWQHAVAVALRDDRNLLECARRTLAHATDTINALNTENQQLSATIERLQNQADDKEPTT